MDCQSRYHPDNAGPETWLNLIGGVADAKTMGTIAFLQRWLRRKAPRPNLANLPVPHQSRASFNRKSVTGNITEIIQATLERSELRMRPGSVQKRSRNPERRRWRLCPRGTWTRVVRFSGSLEVEKSSPLSNGIWVRADAISQSGGPKAIEPVCIRSGSSSWRRPLNPGPLPPGRTCGTECAEKVSVQQGER